MGKQINPDLIIGISKNITSLGEILKIAPDSHKDNVMEIIYELCEIILTSNDIGIDRFGERFFEIMKEINKEQKKEINKCPKKQQS